MTYCLNSFVKYFFIFFTFLGLIIKQKPTPQLNVLSISFSDIPLFFNHLKILVVLILFKLISATKFLGIILLILSDKPPPVILAHPLIKFLSINFNTSLTYILVGLKSSVFKNVFLLILIFFLFNKYLT